MKSLLLKFGIATVISTFAVSLPTILSKIDIMSQVTVSGIFVAAYASALLFLLREAGFIQKGPHEIYKVW
jgi:hypothetical protein